MQVFIFSNVFIHANDRSYDDKNEINFIIVKHDIWNEFIFERSITEMELFNLHIDTDLSEWCGKVGTG